MSYHILHLTTPHIKLYADKGFLFCKFDDETERKLPIDDLKAIVVATHQVGFTNSCLARLLENDIVILHCDNHYKPVGWSAGLDRVVRTNVFRNQINQNNDFEVKLWKTILLAKVNNQSANLKLLNCDNSGLEKLIKRPLISEANIAKKYWSIYFSKLGAETIREHKNATNFENICLNYGYAVISTLIYRSILIHGLCPNLGIHHKENYKSTPLVYDLMEPFRAFVDFFLYSFKVNNSGSFSTQNHKDWCKYLAFSTQNYKLEYKGYYYKMIDYIDIYIESIARAFIDYNVEKVLIPDLNAAELKIEKQGCYEE